MLGKLESVKKIGNKCTSEKLKLTLTLRPSHYRSLRSRQADSHQVFTHPLPCAPTVWFVSIVQPGGCLPLEGTKAEQLSSTFANPNRELNKQLEYYLPPVLFGASILTPLLPLVNLLHQPWRHNQRCRKSTNEPTTSVVDFVCNGGNNWPHWHWSLTMFLLDLRFRPLLQLYQWDEKCCLSLYPKTESTNQGGDFA